MSTVHTHRALNSAPLVSSVATIIADRHDFDGVCPREGWRIWGALGASVRPQLRPNKRPNAWHQLVILSSKQWGHPPKPPQYPGDIGIRLSEHMRLISSCLCSKIFQSCLSATPTSHSTPPKKRDSLPIPLGAPATPSMPMDPRPRGVPPLRLHAAPTGRLHPPPSSLRVVGAEGAEGPTRRSSGLEPKDVHLRGERDEARQGSL